MSITLEPGSSPSNAATSTTPNAQAGQGAAPSQPDSVRKLEFRAQVAGKRQRQDGGRGKEAQKNIEATRNNIDNIAKAQEDIQTLLRF